MSVEHATTLEIIIVLITCAFIIEMGLKLLAHGCAGYWSHTHNLIDGTVVLCSVVELVVLALIHRLPMQHHSGAEEEHVAGVAFLRTLQAQRTLRFVRLLRVPGVDKVVSTFGRALKQMLNLLTLLLLFIVVAALGNPRSVSHPALASSSVLSCSCDRTPRLHSWHADLRRRLFPGQRLLAMHGWRLQRRTARAQTAPALRLLRAGDAHRLYAAHGRMGRRDAPRHCCCRHA
jgi:hypothetical protein